MNYICAAVYYNMFFGQRNALLQLTYVSLKICRTFFV